MATIPCRPDMRQIRFEVQHTRIDNKALAQELQDFTNDCYSVALYLWKQQDQGQTKDKTTLRDIEWIGSSTFLSRYYPSLQSNCPGLRSRGPTAGTAAGPIQEEEAIPPAASGGAVRTPD